jgi:hypothetical protein
VNRPLRILHCPGAVGGNPPALARAERALGLDSHCAILRQNWLRYAVDEVLVPPWLGGRPGQFAAELAAWRLLTRACRTYDLVHLNYGSALLPALPAWEIPADGLAATFYRRYAAMIAGHDLRRLTDAGVAIAVTYQGDDARQGAASDLLGRNLTTIAGPGYYTEASDTAKRTCIATLDHCAARIFFLNPDLARMLPTRARFMPYAHVDARQWTTGTPGDGPLRIVHAPTHRGLKGTAHVLAAIERLRGEGLPIELDIVQNLPHAEALRRYAVADLLIDQLHIGWYGGLAVECMALGKAVVCRLRREDFTCLPPGMADDLPVIDAGPDDLAEVLRRLISLGRDGLRELGARSRRYVERWHDPARIANMLAEHYRAAVAETRGTACAE